MYGLDKAAFGSFLAQLRREKGMTQRELAADLYVSDKAVSKWERGLSVPDISLLVPLAEILNVTVAELLQGRRSAVRPGPRSSCRCMQSMCCWALWALPSSVRRGWQAPRAQRRCSS